ncbi:Tyr-tRNA synthetase [Aspergillus avenaceus]|uniref:tyrosine--tRNA ligase n=1 Tax=Aspergillus avenaceus TaxID=36643 RepID=A0A5N6UA08_ASPAV|nr:Tyr-tRNA synthetase [Aspergillus avenaceus]
MTVDKRLRFPSSRVSLTNGQVIDELLAQGKRIHGFWGTAPTGKPHIGYLVPLIKIAEMVAAGIEFSIYFADEYAYLLNYKDPRHLVAHRTEYYEHLIRAILQALGTPLKGDSPKRKPVEFVRESDLFASIEKSSDDLNRLYTSLSLDDVRSVSEEMETATMFSTLLCPARQSGVFALAERILPHLGYRGRAHLTTDMIPGLTTAKMSSSHEADTKVELLDTPDVVHSKIEDATCIPGVVEGNALLAIAKHILLPLSSLRMAMDGESYRFNVCVEGKDRTYSNYEDLQHDFLTQCFAPGELKVSVATGLNRILDPIRKDYESNEAWRKVELLAYTESSST